MDDRILIYGANGFTGQLLVEEAVRLGLEPVLAGRSGREVRRLASRHGLEYRIASLSEPEFLDVMLDGVACVAHVAGPFEDTYRPMLDACIRTGTHYVDITGEIDVLEAIAARNTELSAANVVAIPGAGFDVVPSDCLVAHTAARLPDAHSLTVFVSADGRPSRGTAKTSIRSIDSPSRVRRNGEIVPFPGDPRRTFDNGTETVEALVVSWGDVSTAYHSTGIGEIVVLIPSNPALGRLAAAPDWMTRLLATPPAQRALEALVERTTVGPPVGRRRRSSSTIIAQVFAPDGRMARSRLTTPNGYELTARTSIETARRVAAGGVTPGFHTPSRAFGADFILEFEGCEREDF